MDLWLYFFEVKSGNKKTVITFKKIVIHYIDLCFASISLK